MEDKTMENTDKTYTEEQFKGLLADKQAEVRKRQDAEKRLGDLEREMERLKKIDPHAPSADDEPEPNPEDRPLTMRDLIDLLGDGPGTETPSPKPAGRMPGAPGGHSLAWFKGNWNTPVSQLSDAELDKLAAEVN